jgi:hypothetical protein
VLAANKLKDLLCVANLAVCEHNQTPIEACAHWSLEDLIKRRQQLGASQVSLDILRMITRFSQRVLVVGNRTFEEKLSAATKTDDVETTSLGKTSQKELQRLCCAADLTTAH